MSASELQESDRYLPLHFLGHLNSVEESPTFLEFDLKDRRKLRIGATQFSIEDFSLDFYTWARQEHGAKSYQYSTALEFKWPAELMQEGEIIVRNTKGKVIWRDQVNAQTRQEWTDFVNKVKEGKSDDPQIRRIFFMLATPESQSQFGRNLGSDFSKVFSEARLQFCLRPSATDTKAEVCSPLLIKHTTSQYVRSYRPLLRIPHKGFVSVNGQDYPVQARILPGELPIEFKAELSNGASLKFTRPDGAAVVTDITRGEDHKILIGGYGPKPKKGHFLSSYFSFWDLIYWDATIAKPKRFWALEIENQQPIVIDFAEAAIDSFQVRFQFDDVPDEKLRVFAHKRLSTYSSEPEIPIVLPKEFPTSARLEGQLEKEEDNLYYWTMPAPKIGNLNTGTLEVIDGDKKWVLSHDIYRGFPLEVSSRVQGLATLEGELALLGEVAGTYWIEDLFGWQNNYLSVQRWGVGARYFANVFGLGNAESSFIFDMAVVNFDLRYRFVQGIWSRDESFGLKLDYQDVHFIDTARGSLDAQLVGGGLFWARSMPKMFDTIFNYLKILRYPKFVDVDFVYYPMALDKNTELNFNAALNFHGKILWTPRFFSEVGFGMKQYDFIDRKLQLRVNTTLGYATVGLGLHF